MGVLFLAPLAVLGAETGAASAPAAMLPMPVAASGPAAASTPVALAQTASTPASAPAPSSAPVPASAPLAASVGAASAAVPASALVLPAASAPAPASAPASTWIPNIPAIPALDVINAPRDYLSKEFLDLITGVDHFFGTDRNYQETNDSVLQVDWTRALGYGGDHRYLWQGKAKVHLPNTEKRLHLLIESNPDTNTANASAQVQANQPVTNANAPTSYGAGLRWELKSADDRWHLGTDGGLKFAGLNTTPFLRARGSYGVPLDDHWQLKAAETAFWFNSTGVGETTELAFEHPLDDSELFRATTSATWLNDRQGFDLRQDLSIYQTVDKRTAMLYQAAAIGAGTANLQSQVNDYVLLMLYRHQLHREWMYLEISPQLHFPREHNFVHSGALNVRLEILFDRSK